ncbi:MAG: hypothetical protein ACLUHE_17050 [Christensenellales bacterium]
MAKMMAAANGRNDPRVRWHGRRSCWRCRDESGKPFRCICAACRRWRRRRYAFMPRFSRWIYLWLLGMPGGGSGARVSRPGRQPLADGVFTACYVLTHALIVLIGLSAAGDGRTRRAPHSRRWLLIFAGAWPLTAFFANRALGTDFLFAAPPIRTPLEWNRHRLSYGAYIACLQGMMALLAWAHGRRGTAALRQECIDPPIFSLYKIRRMRYNKTEYRT